MEWSLESMSDSFVMINVTPQNGSFNTGVWKRLENRVRKWAQANGEIYVVTDPVLTDGPYKKIGENEVSIPKRFYKVILDYKEPGLKAIGFIIPNQRCPETRNRTSS